MVKGMAAEVAKAVQPLWTKLARTSALDFEIEAALWAVTHSYPHVADLIDHEISQGAISASGVNRCVVMDVRVVFMGSPGMGYAG